MILTQIKLIPDWGLLLAICSTPSGICLGVAFLRVFCLVIIQWTGAWEGMIKQSCCITYNRHQSSAKLDKISIDRTREAQPTTLNPSNSRGRSTQRNLRLEDENNSLNLSRTKAKWQENHSACVWRYQERLRTPKTVDSFLDKTCLASDLSLP